MSAATAQNSTAGSSCSSSTTSTRSSRAARRSKPRRSSSSNATSGRTTSRRSCRRAATSRGAQEFTSSKRLLLRAIDNFAGRKLRSATLEKIDDYNRSATSAAAPRRSDPKRGGARVYKARNTMSTLKTSPITWPGVRGRRKAVVFFSEGIDYDVTNPIQNQYASDIREEIRRRSPPRAAERELLRRGSPRPRRPERRGD